MRRALRALLLFVLVACGAPGDDMGGGTPELPPTAPPTHSEPVAVAVVGDMGTGEAAQYDVAEALCEVQPEEGFEVVVTTGDNVYPRGDPEDFDEKFARPYRCLSSSGVEFRAALGNHDVATRRGREMVADERFGMEGSYYSFTHGAAGFVVLDSSRLDDDQLDWLAHSLSALRRWPWTIVVLHHPPYSGGSKHGSDLATRARLEPRLRDSGVDLVLSGHEHLYSRASAGPSYVVTGGGGAELSPCAPAPEAEVVSCTSEHHFVLLRITPESLVVEARAAGGGILDRARLPSLR